MNQTTWNPPATTSTPPPKKIEGWLWKAAAVPGAALVAFLLASGNADAILGLFFLAAMVGAYFIPTIFAASRKHHNIGTIAVVNFFLGWTFIGWVVALAMAASAVRDR